MVRSNKFYFFIKDKKIKMKNNLDIKEVENYIDNIQQITKEKGAAKKSKKRVWNYSGSINLKYKLDNC